MRTDKSARLAVGVKEEKIPSADQRAISRRRIVKSGLALAGAQIAGPFVLSARAAQPIKIGLDNPLTGPYAGLGKNELTGC